MIVSCIITVQIVSGMFMSEIRGPVEGVLVTEYPAEWIVDFSESLERSGYQIFNGIDRYKHYQVSSSECVKR